MLADITKALKDWPFEEKTVRRIVGDDGKPKLQRRLALGILQLETTGRPDGAKPKGCESLFDYFKQRAKDPSFRLTSEECQELGAEALLYYQRRMCYFELNEFENAASDAARNLDVFAFVRRHAESDDSMALDQYRAYVIFHRARALALAAIEKNRFDEAIRAVERGIDEVFEFLEDYGLRDQAGESSEIKQLKRLRKQVEKLKPVSSVDKLKNQLRRAVERENYELAAEIRDKLRNLQ